MVPLALRSLPLVLPPFLAVPSLPLTTRRKRNENGEDGVDDVDENDGEEDHVVESIVKHREDRRTGRKTMLVSWEGYGDVWNSWVPEVSDGVDGVVMFYPVSSTSSSPPRIRSTSRTWQSGAEPDDGK